MLDINRVLNQDAYKDIDTEFQKINIKRGIDLNWYSPIIKNGSLGTIAKDTNRTPEYLFFYEKGSKVMHSASYTDHIKFSASKGGTIIFEPIRNLNDIQELLKQSMSIAIHTYRVIINKYRYGEQENFKKKYMNEWRELFLNIPSITYQSG